MKKKVFTSSVISLALYAIVAVFILCWWKIFLDDPRINTSVAFSHENPEHLYLIPNAMSPIARPDLLKALSGNFELIVKFIADWDIDAQCLRKLGCSKAKRLPPEKFLRSQLLYRSLYPPRANHTKTFLPQTYMAASFLLALVDSHQIIALPKGLRNLDSLFPASITDKIKQDISPYISEKIAQAKPEMAFVAHYSHPATLETLRNQGIPLFTINTIDTLEDIQRVLQEIGHAVERPYESELLSIFIDAAMLAIDNRIQALNFCAPRSSCPKILYLNYYTQFSTPTIKTLSGQLLQRMGILNLDSLFSSDEQCQQWTLPMDYEKINHFKPDCLIISTSNSPALKTKFLNSSFFHHLPAGLSNRVFLVDEAIQQFPSQYIVLAYYDIFNAIASAKLY